METELTVAMVFLAGLAAGVYVIHLGMRQQALHNEMRHRERMAMIERGQIPLEHQREAGSVARSAMAANSRSLSIGIIIAGLGMALAVMIAFAADSPEVALGIGGAITVVGISFIVRSLVVKPAGPTDSAASRPSTDM